MTQPVRITPTFKNFTLRKVTTFLGHEGEELTQADVLYKKKLVGRYSESDWGGPTELQWISEESDITKEAQKVMAQYLEENQNDDFIKLMGKESIPLRLLEMRDCLKSFRKVQRKHVSKGIVLAELSNGPAIQYECHASQMGEVNRLIEAEAEKFKSTVRYVNSYFSAEDFIIE